MQEAYAQALWKMVNGGAAPKAAVKVIHDALLVRGRLGLLPKIAPAFSRIAVRKLACDTVVMHIARKEDEKKAVEEAKSILAEVGVETRDIKFSVDENLIGGGGVGGRERLFDKSYKKNPFSLYNCL